MTLFLNHIDFAITEMAALFNIVLPRECAILMECRHFGVMQAAHSASKLRGPEHLWEGCQMPTLFTMLPDFFALSTSPKVLSMNQRRFSFNCKQQFLSFPLSSDGSSACRYVDYGLYMGICK